MQLPKILAEFKSTAKTTPFIVLDEAQNISPIVLEELRLITNLDAAVAPVLVLVAHGAFKDHLKLACFAPLRYRLALISTIDPLNKSDINAYVSFHLKLAGSSSSLFTDDAITAIFNTSKGLPRLINRVCLESLYLAAQKNISTIDQSIVDAVAIDFV